MQQVGRLKWSRHRHLQRQLEPETSEEAMAETIRFEFIAQERIVYQDDVSMVVAPGASGVTGRAAQTRTVDDPHRSWRGRGQEGRPARPITSRSAAASWKFGPTRSSSWLGQAKRPRRSTSPEPSRPGARRKSSWRSPRWTAEERRQLADLALRRSKIRLKVAERRRKQPVRGPVPRSRRGWSGIGQITPIQSLEQRRGQAGNLPLAPFSYTQI